MKQIFALVNLGKFWTVLGGLIGMAGLFFSSYQFYEAAALNNRTYKGQLALEVQRAVYEFVAQFTQHYKPIKDKELIKKFREDGRGPPIHPEIRLVLIRADGTISRTQIIEQPDIKACLQRMYSIQSTIIESTKRQNKDVNLRENALDLDFSTDDCALHRG